MARKATQGNRGRRSTSRRSSTSSSSSDKKMVDLRKFNNTDIQKVVKKIKGNPLALYLAGGVGALFLSRFAFRYYRSHPEIKDFVRENMDTVENALKEYRGNRGAEEGDLSESRH